MFKLFQRGLTYGFFRISALELSTFYDDSDHGSLKNSFSTSQSGLLPSDATTAAQHGTLSTLRSKAGKQRHLHFNLQKSAQYTSSGLYTKDDFGGISHMI